MKSHQRIASSVVDHSNPFFTISIQDMDNVKIYVNVKLTTRIEDIMRIINTTKPLAYKGILLNRNTTVGMNNIHPNDGLVLLDKFPTD